MKATERYNFKIIKIKKDITGIIFWELFPDLYNYYHVWIKGKKTGKISKIKIFIDEPLSVERIYNAVAQEIAISEEKYRLKKELEEEFNANR